jgi:hypothetical protein
VEAAAASRCQEREEGGWRRRGLTLGAGLVRPRWGRGEEVSLGAGRGGKGNIREALWMMVEGTS